MSITENTCLPNEDIYVPCSYASIETSIRMVRGLSRRSALRSSWWSCPTSDLQHWTWQRNRERLSGGKNSAVSAIIKMLLYGGVKIDVLQISIIGKCYTTLKWILNIIVSVCTYYNDIEIIGCTRYCTRLRCTMAHTVTGINNGHNNLSTFWPLQNGFSNFSWNNRDCEGIHTHRYTRTRTLFYSCIVGVILLLYCLYSVVFYICVTLLVY